MLPVGPARKITIHLNEDTSSPSDFLSGAILKLLFERGIAGATVMRPEAGFGAHHRMHSGGGGMDTGRHMPLQIEFIDTVQSIDALLPALRELVTDGLIEAQDTAVLWAAVGPAA